MDESPIKNDEQLLLIGTQADGVYACQLNLTDGALSVAKLVAEAPQPGFLALHPRHPLVYAITKEPTEPNGGVRSWRISDRLLVPFSQIATGDTGATHLEVAPDGTTIVVAHYAGGSTALVPLGTDGALRPVSSLVEHTGSSAHPARQTEPHAHGATYDTSGQFVFLADLGTDEVIVYRIDQEHQLKRVSAWNAPPGAGPRHLALHPNGNWLYSINELNSTVSVLEWAVGTAQLRELDTLPTLPNDFHGENLTAEIVVHPTGTMVYGSNRGHDSTAVFAVDPVGGTLELKQIEPTLGDHPRHIGVDPSGKFLIAANRDSDNLVSFRIDAATGELAPTGFRLKVPKPVCVVSPKI